jgi:hypothetical protein
MKRLYYLSKNLDAIDDISQTLHDAGISDWNFHVLSKDKAGLTTHRLHSTNPFHERDILRAAERGALIGITASISCALVLITTNALPVQTSYMALAALVLVCSLFGTWAGGFFGIQTENYKVRQFHTELEDGQHLLMIDVDKKHEYAIRRLMAHHREAVPMGVDTPVVMPFGKPSSITF